MSSTTRRQLLGVALTSLLTLTWFRLKPIYYADMSLGTTLQNTSPTYLAALFKSNLLGLSQQPYPTTQSVPSALFYTFTVNIVHTFAPLWLSQFFYVYLLALFAGLGVCALIRRASSSFGVEPPWWVGVTAGAFYFYGPYYQFFVGDGAFISLGFYASYPLMLHSSLGLTKLGSGDVRQYLRDLLLLLAAFLVGSGGFTYYYYITGMVSIVFISAIYLALGRRGLRGVVLGVAGLVAGLAAAQLSLAPLLAHDLAVGPTLAQSNTTSPNLLTLFEVRTKHTQYFDELTQNFWPAPGPFSAVDPNLPSYLTSPIIGVAFLFLLLTLLLLTGPVADLTRKIRASAPFLSAYFLVVALAAGPNPPFGVLLLKAFTSFWFVRAISESFTSLNFIFQLCLATLLGLALAAATARRPHTKPRAAKKTWIPVILLVALTLALVAPYASGSPLPKTTLVAYPAGQAQPSTVTPRVTIPQYFYQLVSYVDGLPPHGAVLLLPVGGNFRTTSWYIAVDALSSTLNKPVVGGGYVSTPQTEALVDLAVMWQEGANIDLQPVLARAGVGYVVVEGDAATAPPYTPEPPFNLTQIVERLNDTQNIRLLARFGPDLVYSVAWQNTAVQTYWGANPTYSYGFSAYTLAIEANPEPQRPYNVLYTPSAAELESTGNACSLSEGSISISFAGGFGECAFRAHVDSSSPIYVSVGYGGGPTNLGVELLGAKNESVEGYAVAQYTNGGQTYAVFAFPPGDYSGLQVYAAGQAEPGAAATVDWIYASDAASPQELVGYAENSSALYVTPPNGGGTTPTLLVNSTQSPHVDSWSCGAYGCSVELSASQPFFFVYYTSFSEAYTLYVNGKPDTNHYLAYGAYNAWLVDGSGNLTLKVEYKDPLLPYEATAVSVWVVVLLLNLFYVRRTTKSGWLGAHHAATTLLRISPSSRRTAAGPIRVAIRSSV